MIARLDDNIGAGINTLPYFVFRMKIMQNIGLVFVKMGQYTDAITSFDYIMSDNPDYKTGLHLLLCYYALGDKEEMKKSFLKLLEITNENDDEDKYVSHMVGISENNNFFFHVVIS